VPRLLLLTPALCLLLAFIWGSTGSSCLEAVHQWHRSAQLKRIATTSADTLILSRSEFIRLSVLDKHEIRYGANMFDITGIAGDGDSVVLSGHYDGFDRKLFKVVDAFLGGTTGAASDQCRLHIFVFTGILPAGIKLIDRTMPSLAIRNPTTESEAPLPPVMVLPLPPPDSGDRS